MSRSDKEWEACTACRGREATWGLGKSRRDEVLGAEAATKGRRGPVGGVWPPLPEEVWLPQGERAWLFEQKKKKTGLGFLSHETKQTEVYAADITSAVLISCYLIFQALNMLREALVSRSNPLAFLFSISRTISIISFSYEKARNWKFPGAFKGWAPLRSIQEQPHLDTSSLDPEFIFFKTWNWRLVPTDTLNSQYHLTSGW